MKKSLSVRMLIPTQELAQNEMLKQVQHDRSRQDLSFRTRFGISSFIAFVLVVLFVASLIIGCAPSSTRASTPAPATGQAGPVPAKPAWQVELEKALVQAQKEGMVRIYGELSAETRQAISRSFKERYGIELEFVVGKGAEIIPRITSEYAAGINLADIFISGGFTNLIGLKPKGILRNLDAMLLLPEVKDPNTWLGGSPFLDKDHTAITLVSGVTPQVIVNTELVKEGGVKSFQDLLKPEYKGKIVFYDPTIGGTANHWVTFLLTKIYPNDRESALRYLRQFAAQQPVIIRDARLQMEWVAQGKYPVAVGASFQVVTDFVAAGSPVKRVHISEATSITAAAGVLSAPVKPEHPNAAVIFVNWLLGEEGQRSYAEAFGSAPVRIGVKTAIRDPSAVPLPTEKLIGEDEEFYLSMPEARDIAKEIFGHLMK